MDKTADIEQAITLTLADKFVASTPVPGIWMIEDYGTNHVEVDVSQAFSKVLVVFNHGAVETLSPERTCTGFTFVVKVGELAFQLLHEAADISRIRGIFL